MTDEPSKFSVWLRERMGARKQGQVAQYVGVSSSTVTRWLHGKSRPEAHNIVRLGEYFGVEPKEIEALLPDPLIAASQKVLASVGNASDHNALHAVADLLDDRIRLDFYDLLAIAGRLSPADVTKLHAVLQEAKARFGLRGRSS